MYVNNSTSECFLGKAVHEKDTADKRSAEVIEITQQLEQQGENKWTAASISTSDWRNGPEKHQIQQNYDMQAEKQKYYKHAKFYQR